MAIYPNQRAHEHEDWCLRHWSRGFTLGGTCSCRPICTTKVNTNIKDEKKMSDEYDWTKLTNGWQMGCADGVIQKDNYRYTAITGGLVTNGLNPTYAKQLYLEAVEQVAQCKVSAKKTLEEAVADLHAACYGKFSIAPAAGSGHYHVLWAPEPAGPDWGFILGASTVEKKFFIQDPIKDRMPDYMLRRYVATVRICEYLLKKGWTEG